MAPTVIKVFEHIDQQKRKGEIPSEIRSDLIERILDDDKCICGRSVLGDPGAHAYILEWQKRTSDVTTQDAALNLWRHLSEVRHHFSDDADMVEKRLLQYGNIHNNIKNIEHELAGLSNQIGTSERKDASKLDGIRKCLQEKIIDQEVTARFAQTQLEQLQQENVRLHALLKEEKLKVVMNDELSRRSILARDTKDALTEVFNQFTDEIKDLIGESATQLFRELLDKEGRENLRTIVVNDDYSLQVLDRYKKPFLANISAGQRQIMSISFIAAWQGQQHEGTKLKSLCLWIPHLDGYLTSTDKTSLIWFLHFLPNGSSSQLILNSGDKKLTYLRKVENGVSSICYVQLMMVIRRSWNRTSALLLRFFVMRRITNEDGWEYSRCD
jgi:DNA sulfur modification protein DndD